MSDFAAVPAETFVNTHIELLFSFTLASTVIKNIQSWPFEELHRATVAAEVPASVPQAELAPEADYPLFVESLFCWLDSPPDLNSSLAAWFCPALLPSLDFPSNVWKQRSGGGLSTSFVGTEVHSGDPSQRRSCNAVFVFKCLPPLKKAHKKTKCCAFYFAGESMGRLRDLLTA